DGVGTELGEITSDLDAVLLAQPLLRDGTGGYGRSGEPCRRAPSSARIADAVLAQVRVVGVPGPEARGDLRVVLAALVDVADQQRDGRAGGLALVHAGEDLHQVVLAALRDVARRSGLAAIEVGLDVGFAEVHPRRAAIDHAADRGTVRFAEGGDGEE